MASREQEISVTWSALIQQRKPHIDYGLKYIWTQIKKTSQKRSSNVSLSSFSVFAEALCEAAIIIGSEDVINIFDLSREVFKEIILESEINIEDRQYTRAIAVLNYINSGKCCECEFSPEIEIIQNNLILKLADHSCHLEDENSRTLALSAIALRLPEMANIFLGDENLPQEFLPGKTFQFNAPGFINYMAIATQVNAAYEDIEPAWIDFLNCFPRKLAAQTLNWTDLFWSARIIVEQFQKKPVGLVAQTIYNLVRR